MNSQAKDYLHSLEQIIVWPSTKSSHSSLGCRPSGGSALLGSTVVGGSTAFGQNGGRGARSRGAPRSGSTGGGLPEPFLNPLLQKHGVWIAHSQLINTALVFPGPQRLSVHLSGKMGTRCWELRGHLGSSRKVHGVWDKFSFFLFFF